MDSLFPILLLLVAFGLLIVLPARQRKKMAERQAALQESLTPGTPVMLTSGIHGSVVRLGDGTVDLEIAPGVVVTVVRQAVLEVRTPAGANAASYDDDGMTDGTADGDPTDRSR